MDLGSMNKARIEVRGSREAMTIQVSFSSQEVLRRFTLAFFSTLVYIAFTVHWCTLFYLSMEAAVKRA